MSLSVTDHLKKEALKLSLKFHAPEEGIDKSFATVGVITTPLLFETTRYAVTNGLEGAPIVGIMALADAGATLSFFGVYDRSTSSKNIIEELDYSDLLLDKDSPLTEYSYPWTLWKNKDCKICTENSHFPKLIRKDGRLGQSFHEIKFEDGYLIGISGSTGHVIGPNGNSMEGTEFSTKGHYGKNYDAYPAKRFGFMYGESYHCGSDFSRPPRFKILAKLPNQMMAEYL